jgi:RNAse (barnase) inhibitor barstar
MTAMLEYVDSTQSDLEPEDFVLLVPPGIRSKKDLLAVLADIGHFPDYFGGNWDALQDCLGDLSWITNRKVVILHSDVPLQSNPSECRIYLEILQTALANWSRAPKSNTVEPPPEWPYVEHELRVVFPIETRTAIACFVESA